MRTLVKCIQALDRFYIFCYVALNRHTLTAHTHTCINCKHHQAFKSISNGSWQENYSFLFAFPMNWLFCVLKHESETAFAQWEKLQMNNFVEKKTTQPKHACNGAKFKIPWETLASNSSDRFIDFLCEWMCTRIFYGFVHFGIMFNIQ